MIRCLLNFAFHGDRWSREFDSRKEQRDNLLPTIGKFCQKLSGLQYPSSWGSDTRLANTWQSFISQNTLKNKESYTSRSPNQRSMPKTIYWSKRQTRDAVQQWWHASDLELQNIWDTTEDNHVGAQLWGINESRQTNKTLTEVLELKTKLGFRILSEAISNLNAHLWNTKPSILCCNNFVITGKPIILTLHF